MRLIAFVFALLCALPAQAESVLAKLLPQIEASELVPGADGFGAIGEDLAVAPILSGGTEVGHVFITSDFVGTTGYSGKPIHVAVALDAKAHVLGVALVKHSEPVVLIGIPEAEVRKMIVGYVGLDLTAGEGPAPDIISGATVTVMVIDDSIVRSGIKVARALGLGGLTPEADTAPRAEIDPEATAPEGWQALEGDGTIRKLSLDVGQVNAAFAALPDPRVGEHPLLWLPPVMQVAFDAS